MQLKQFHLKTTQTQDTNNTAETSKTHSHHDSRPQGLGDPLSIAPKKAAFVPMLKPATSFRGQDLLQYSLLWGLLFLHSSLPLPLFSPLSRVSYPWACGSVRRALGSWSAARWSPRRKQSWPGWGRGAAWGYGPALPAWGSELAPSACNKPMHTHTHSARLVLTSEREREREREGQKPYEPTGGHT